MLSKTILRIVYNRIHSRQLRVMCIKAASACGLPVLRIGLDTNNLCNLRCIMCHMALPELRQKPRIMTKEEFGSIAKQVFPKTRLLDLSCGYEPFLTKGFIDYVRIARKYCKGQISICTNAHLIDNNTLKAIVAEQLLDEINISCDGLQQSTFSSIRKGGDYNVFISVLQRIDQTKREFKTNRPRLRLNYTMMRRNIEDLQRIKAFVDQYGFDILQLRHVKLSSPFKSIFKESLFYHQDISDRILRKVSEQFAKDHTKQLICPPFFSENIKSRTTKNRCAYPWFNFQITSDGKLRMCSIGTIGNLNENTFNDILKSKEVKSIYRDILRGASDRLCRSCNNISDMNSVAERETFIND